MIVEECYINNKLVVLINMDVVYTHILHQLNNLVSMVTSIIEN